MVLAGRNLGLEVRGNVVVTGTNCRQIIKYLSKWESKKEKKMKSRGCFHQQVANTWREWKMWKKEGKNNPSPIHWLFTGRP